MRRAWFICIVTSEPDGEEAWNDQQSLMYQFLRRLISCNKYFVLDKGHVQQLSIGESDIFTSSRLEASTFFDNGEHIGRMFSYGSMNETAFESTI
jgi:hypothetical protein